MKSSTRAQEYERFGETIRYLTIEELNQFLDAIENYRHKLMMRLVYELGCRVGEFVRIQLKHVNFARETIYFPAENTKTKQRRVSHVPLGLMNELKSFLRASNRMPQRTSQVYRADDYLFSPNLNARRRYSENRLRQIFARYIRAVGIDREYGRDAKGRALHELTIHSLRHSHIMHYVHSYKLPLPVVQRQVGHKTLKATSVYLRPSDEHVGQAYADARRHQPPMTKPPQGLKASPSSFEDDKKQTNPTRQREAA